MIIQNSFRLLYFLLGIYGGLIILDAMWNIFFVWKFKRLLVCWITEPGML